MKKKLIIGSLLLLLIACTNTPKVCNNECFEVEIANTPESRAKGLMNKKSLDQDKGMLFTFEEEGVYSFWMKNTFIPLDIIWINKDLKVVFIKRNATPCKDTCPSINPQLKAKYVLELNPYSNVNVEDKLTFHNI